MMLLNLLVSWLSWTVADLCEPWGAGWWLNMFASALNAVIFFNNFVNQIGL